MASKFWMVYGESPNGSALGYPTFKHPTKLSAQNEAGRLANKFPNEYFYVLEAFSRVIKNEVQWSDLEEPPQEAYNKDVPF